MWIWDQSAGTLYRPDGSECAIGYSGFGAGKNKPSMQAVKGIGPIPQGTWVITGVYNSKRVGPFALILEPHDKNRTFGRSAFRIHGDSVKNPGTASHGCIILARKIREEIYNSGDKLLKVIE